MVKGGKPRQRDIAQLAQVSQTAVSLVLNGKADEQNLSAAAQAKIRKAMEELNYVPNAAARALRGGRNGIIGVHTYDPVFPVNSGNYYHDFLAGSEEMAAEMGVDLVLFASTQRPDGTRSIYGRGGNRLSLADGTIMLGLERNDEELLQLAHEGHPFVFIGRRELPGVELPYVTTDYAGAVTAVVDLLVDHGHRSVCYLAMRDRDMSPQQERRMAFQKRADRVGLQFEIAPHADEDIDADWIRRTVDRGWTALVVESHLLANRVAVSAQQANFAFPDDLSVICLDVPAADSPASGWSHIRVPRREMGRRALAILTGILDGELPPAYREVLPCHPQSENHPTLGPIDSR